MSIDEMQKMFPHRFNEPRIAPSAWIAPGAQVYGDVWIGDESNIWFNAVLRGDVNFIRVGKRTNVQDNSVVHVTHHGNETVIGDDVTIGHSAIIHACKIGNHSLIGMGSIVLDGAEIGDFVMLGAGSLVTQNTKIPSGMKAFGRPAKVVAPISDAERAYLLFSSDHYVRLAKTYFEKSAKNHV